MATNSHAAQHQRSIAAVVRPCCSQACSNYPRLHALSTIGPRFPLFPLARPRARLGRCRAHHHAFSRTQFFIETVRLQVSRSLHTSCKFSQSRRHPSLPCPPCASYWHIYVLPEDDGPQAPLLREAPRPLVVAKGRHGHARQQGSPCVGCRRRVFLFGKLNHQHSFTFTRSIND